MANISSYPLITPKASDIILFTETYDANAASPVIGNPTRSTLISDLGGSITSFPNSIKTNQLKLSSLNTAPASATAAGVLGEIRITASYIYVCSATNVWVRSSLASW
jgi:hypothetical protein